MKRHLRQGSVTADRERTLAGAQHVSDIYLERKVMAKKLWRLLHTVILRDSYTFLYAFSCIGKYTNKDAMKFTRCGLFASRGQLVLTLIIATWIQLFSAICDQRGLDGQLLFTLIIPMDPTFLCLLLSTRTRSQTRDLIRVSVLQTMKKAKDMRHVYIISCIRKMYFCDKV
jgi:hypothetical protein